MIYAPSYTTCWFFHHPTVPRAPLGGTGLASNAGAAAYAAPANPSSSAGNPNAASVTESSSGANSKGLLTKLSQLTSEDFWKTAPKNFIRGYEHTYYTFKYVTGNKREVQCIIMLLPGGVATRSLENVDYEVSEDGSEFVVTFPAPGMFSDGTQLALSSMYDGEEQQNKPDWNRRQVALETLLMEMKPNEEDKFTLLRRFPFSSMCQSMCPKMMFTGWGTVMEQFFLCLISTKAMA